MCQGKIIRSYELRAQVVSLDEKAGLLEVEVHVCVDQRVVADLHLVLDLEHLRGGLVVWGIVGREVAHVHAQLDGQDLHELEGDVQVAVNAERRQGEDLRVARQLVAKLIVPAECPITEVLVETRGDNLYVTVVLDRKSGCACVDIVLDALQSGCKPCPRGFEEDLAADVELLYVAEGIVPGEVACPIVAEVERRGVIHNRTVDFDSCVLTEELKFRLRDGGGANLADVVAEDAQFTLRVISNQRT